MELSSGCPEEGLALEEKRPAEVPSTVLENGDRSLHNGFMIKPQPSLGWRAVQRARQRCSMKATAIFCTILLGYMFVHCDVTGYALIEVKILACGWLRICGLGGWAQQYCSRDAYFDVVTTPDDLSNDAQVMNEIPQYVLDYAPLVHLFSGEHFWPSDIAEHLFHVTPALNYTPIQGRLHYSNLSNLDELNEYERGRHVFLTSNDNVEERPDWLGSEKNIPNGFDDGDDEKESNADRIAWRSKSGRSDAPAVLVTVDKGKGIIDAFWFFFYSYNLGNKVLNIRFGNHVGDWEHTLVRFHHGKPRLVYLSEHNFGEAYSYDAVEKIGKRVSITNTSFPALTANSI